MDYLFALPPTNQGEALMQRLWMYEDFVSHLSHVNRLVRTWAFTALREQCPRRFAPEVSKLIGDPDEHLACAAPKYVADHGAIEFAPAILDSFLKGKGNVPGNCAIALGNMRYEPAVGTLLDMLPRCRDSNTLWGILHYLGKIHREDAHLALRESFPVLSESYLADGAAFFLLEHGDPEDVPLVLDTWFRRTDPKAKKDRFLGRVLESAEASGLFEEIVEYGSCDVLTAPRGALAELLKEHPLIHPDPSWISEVVRLIEAGRLQHLATTLMLDARSKVRQRYSEHQPEGRHDELYASDMLSLAFLEEFSRRSSDLEDVMKNENVVRNIIATLLACHLSILEREAFIRALRPEATPGEMVAALKGSGKDFPSSLQDRLVELSPVQELKGALTEICLLGVMYGRSAPWDV